MKSKMDLNLMDTKVLSTWRACLLSVQSSSRCIYSISSAMCPFVSIVGQAQASDPASDPELRAQTPVAHKGNISKLAATFITNLSTPYTYPSPTYHSTPSLRLPSDRRCLRLPSEPLIEEHVRQRPQIHNDLSSKAFLAILNVVGGRSEFESYGD